MNTLSNLGPTHLLNEPFSLRSTVTVCTDQSCISFHFKYFIDKSIDWITGYAYTNPLQQQDGTVRKQFT